MNTIDISHNFGVILLAAGGSSRLGQSKQMTRLEGETLVARLARFLLGLNPTELIVVTGSGSSEIETELEKYPLRQVYNRAWTEGMGGSIARAVEQLKGEVVGVMIVLCDQWGLTQSDLDLFVKSSLSDISAISVASWGESANESFGPPVFFPRELFFELKTLKGDQGARPLIEKYRNRVNFVKLDNAAFDLDVPEDLKLMTQA